MSSTNLDLPLPSPTLAQLVSHQRKPTSLFDDTRDGNDETTVNEIIVTVFLRCLFPVHGHSLKYNWGSSNLFLLLVKNFKLFLLSDLPPPFLTPPSYHKRGQSYIVV